MTGKFLKFLVLVRVSVQEHRSCTQNSEKWGRVGYSHAWNLCIASVVLFYASQDNVHTKLHKRRLTTYIKVLQSHFYFFKYFKKFKSRIHLQRCNVFPFGTSQKPSLCRFFLSKVSSVCTVHLNLTQSCFCLKLNSLLTFFILSIVIVP